MSDPRTVLQAHLQLARYELVMAEQKVQSIESILILSQQQQQGQGAAPSAQPGSQGANNTPAAHFQAQRAAMVQALALQQRQQELQAQQHNMYNPAAAAGAPAVMPAPPAATTAAAAPVPVPKKKRKRKVQVDKDGNILKKPASGYTMYMTETMVRNWSKWDWCFLFCCFAPDSFDFAVLYL